MKSQMTIGKKLMLNVGGLLTVALILGVASLYQVRELSGSLDHAINVTTKKIKLADEIGLMAERMRSSQRAIAVYGYAKSATQVDKAVQVFTESSEACGKAVAAIRPMLVTDEAKRLMTELDESRATWASVISEMKKNVEAGDVDGAIKVGVGKGIPAYEMIAKGSRRLVELQDGLVVTERSDAADLSSTSRWITLSLLVAAFALGVVVIFVVRRISRTLQSATTQLSENAGQVEGAAQQVSSASQSLAQGASEQAASLEETSASAEEITSMTRRNADNSRSAAELMGQTASVVTDANRSLDQMQTSMKEINESSDKIGKIIKVIDEIAFQTNILALNAAVEAARAGEAGMGFAVVADEVRNLAQRSAQAAKDTASLIEESISKSTEGRTKLDQVAEAIRNITTSAEQVKTLIDEVKLGSEEQARGIEQISKAIAQMEQVTQKSAANAEEAASAGEEMSSQATAMTTTLDELVTMVGSDGSSEIRPARKSRQPLLKLASRPEKSTESLDSLRKAVAPAHEEKPVPAMTIPNRTQSTIPLDDDFKSF